MLSELRCPVHQLVINSKETISPITRLYQCEQFLFHFLVSIAEFGLYIPVSIITKTLVGSDAYEGNVMEYTANDDELMVRAIIDENSVEPLKYALLQSFDGLDISTVDLWEEDDDEMELPF